MVPACHGEQVAPAELLDSAVERTILTAHVGLSGAALERVRLADGRALIVKRITRENDLTLRLLGGEQAGEYVLWRSGALDRLPAGVEHAIVDGWVEGDTTVIVMHDLGDTVLTWDDRLDRGRTAWLLERVARLHDAFLGQPPPPEALAPLRPILELFAPSRMQPLSDAGSRLAAASLRGWSYLPDLVPPDVADPLLALVEDATPLEEALLRRPLTLVHGDLAVVNMAVVDLPDGPGARGRSEPDLLLLDWAMPTAAPGALDVARFLVGCAHVIEPGHDEFMTMYAGAAGASYDDTAVRLALLAGLTWLGWNKTHDIVESPDPLVQEREKQSLAWWVRQARKGLELL